jgi:hypothetical protein
MDSDGMPSLHFRRDSRNLPPFGQASGVERGDQVHNKDDYQSIQEVPRFRGEDCCCANNQRECTMSQCVQCRIMHRLMLHVETRGRRWAACSSSYIKLLGHN